jgi:ABC-type transport system involved in Fe-S cluster assembly fused permease/ATPase subunit
LLMLQLSSLAAYINNNTEWLRVGVRGYVIDCLHVLYVSINHYQKMFCVVLLICLLFYSPFSIAGDKSHIPIFA